MVCGGSLEWMRTFRENFGPLRCPKKMFTEQSRCFADGSSGYFPSVDGVGYGGVLTQWHHCWWLLRQWMMQVLLRCTGLVVVVFFVLSTTGDGVCYGNGVCYWIKDGWEVICWRKYPGSFMKKRGGVLMGAYDGWVGVVEVLWSESCMSRKCVGGCCKTSWNCRCVRHVCCYLRYRCWLLNVISAKSKRSSCNALVLSRLMNFRWHCCNL